MKKKSVVATMIVILIVIAVATIWFDGSYWDCQSEEVVVETGDSLWSIFVAHGGKDNFAMWAEYHTSVGNTSRLVPGQKIAFADPSTNMMHVTPYIVYGILMCILLVALRFAAKEDKKNVWSLALEKAKNRLFDDGFIVYSIDESRHIICAYTAWKKRVVQYNQYGCFDRDVEELR